MPEADKPAMRLPEAPHMAALYKWRGMNNMISKSFDIALARVREYRLSLNPPDLFIAPDLRGSALLTTRAASRR